MSGLKADVVLRRLKRLYPQVSTTLDWDTQLELLIATILSAQCTDKRVNIVTASLFKKYRCAEDYLRAPEDELKRDIRSCGHFNAKCRAIRESCRMIIGRFGGRVPKTMAEMVTLRGVGRKTAAVVLSAAFGVQEGIAVDTHVMRVSRRLGLTGSKSQSKIELDLMKSAPRKEWSDLSNLLIAHGRAVCTARNRKCGICVFATACPSSLAMDRKDKAK